MSLRYYANAAPQLSLQALTSGATSAVLSSGTFSGWPASFPYYATINIGQADAEIVQVTNVVGTTATIVRGQDGTAAVGHLAGATFDQTVVALDFREANDHINDTSTHGVSGNIVGTSDSQTLSNKTLTSPTINSGALSGTFSGDHTLSGGLTLTKAGTALTINNSALVNGTVTAAAFSSNSAAITAGLTAGTATALLVPKSFANEAAAGTQTQGALAFLTAPTHAWGAGVYVSAGGGTWLPFSHDQASRSYTPALTASVTNPTLGTGGGTAGKWAMTGGKSFVADIQITFGSAFAAAGSGTFAISLPASCSFGASGLYGFGHIKCAGVYTPVQAILSGSPAATVNLYYITAAVGGALNSVAHNVPGAWTNNDLIRLRVFGDLA